MRAERVEPHEAAPVRLDPLAQLAVAHRPLAEPDAGQGARLQQREPPHRSLRPSFLARRRGTSLLAAGRHRRLTCLCRPQLRRTTGRLLLFSGCLFPSLLPSLLPALPPSLLLKVKLDRLGAVVAVVAAAGRRSSLRVPGSEPGRLAAAALRCSSLHGLHQRGVVDRVELVERRAAALLRWRLVVIDQVHMHRCRNRGTALEPPQLSLLRAVHVAGKPAATGCAGRWRDPL